MIEDGVKFKRRVALMLFFLFTGFVIGTDGEKIIITQTGPVLAFEEEDSRGVEDAIDTEVVSEEVGEVKEPVKAPSDNYVHGHRDYEQQVEFLKIALFVKSYRGSQIDQEYLNLLYNSCGGDISILRNVIAMAVAETGMCRDTPLKNNCWGFFKGGDRNYDPDRETMADDICHSYSTDYRNLPSKGSLAVYIYGLGWDDLSPKQKGSYGNGSGGCGHGVLGEKCRADWALSEMDKK